MLFYLKPSLRSVIKRGSFEKSYLKVPDSNDKSSFRDSSSDDDQQSANDGLLDIENIYDLRRRNGRPFFRRRWWWWFLLGHTVLFLIYIGIPVAVYKYAKRLGAIRGPNLAFCNNWLFLSFFLCYYCVAASAGKPAQLMPV